MYTKRQHHRLTSLPTLRWERVTGPGRVEWRTVQGGDYEIACFDDLYVVLHEGLPVRDGYESAYVAKVAAVEHYRSSLA